MAARIIRAAQAGAGWGINIEVISQWPWLSISPIVKRIRASPIRFIRAVIIPAARDFGF